MRLNTILQGDAAKTLRRTFVRGAVAVLALLASVAAGEAADAYYLRMMRQGTDAYLRRDYPTAVRSLRVAVFGLLDEPEVLADGLTRLALAQAAANDPDGFRATFNRLVEAEERFQAYSTAAIPSEVRSALEKLVITLVPEANLAQSTGFSHLVPRPEEKLARLPVKQQRVELARLANAEPRQVKWPLMLAQLELADGKPEEAIAAASVALKVQADSPEARKIRGLASLAQRRWAQAVPDLQASKLAGRDPAVAEALLVCLNESKRYQESVDLAGTLPPALAARPRVAELTAAAGRALLAARPSPTSTPTPTATAVPTRPAPQPAPTRTVPPMSSPAPVRSSPTPLAPNPTPTGRPAAATPTIAARSEAPPLATPAATLDKAGRDALAAANDLIRSGKLAEAWVVAQRLADANPGVAEAQHVAAEAAYRIARWGDSVLYFRRGGEPPDDQPLRQFYFAVALFETGERDSAAAMIRRSLPRIRRNAYVEEYLKRILEK